MVTRFTAAAIPATATKSDGLGAGAIFLMLLAAGAAAYLYFATKEDKEDEPIAGIKQEQPN